MPSITADISRPYQLSVSDSRYQMSTKEPYYDIITSVKTARGVVSTLMLLDDDVLMFRLSDSHLLVPPKASISRPTEPYYAKTSKQRRLSVPDDYFRTRKFVKLSSISNESAITSDDDSDTELEDYQVAIIHYTELQNGSVALRSRPPSARNSFHSTVSDNFSPINSCGTSKTELAAKYHFERADFTMKDSSGTQKPDIFEDYSDYIELFLVKSNFPNMVTNEKSRSVSASLNPPSMDAKTFTRDNYDTAFTVDVRDDYENMATEVFLL